MVLLPEGAFSTILLLGVCVSNSCTGDSTNAPENLDRTKGASHWSTSKAKKHPLAKAPFRQARGNSQRVIYVIISAGL